jgi:ferric-dicitrate binding protein FerR (iron transport regulator)
MSRKPTNAVIAEAVRWFHRFRMKGPTALSPDESAEWARWAASAAHLAQFLRVEQLWENLPHSSKSLRPTQQELDADNYDGEQPLSEWLTGAGTEKSNR